MTDVVEIVGTAPVSVIDVITTGPPGPQGPPGAPGPVGASGDGLDTATASVDLSGHRAVAFAVSGALQYADCATPAHAWASVAITTGAAMAGTQAEIIVRGYLDEPSWSWTPQLPVFVGLAGALTQTAPSGAGRFSRAIAVAVTPTRLWVNLQPPIVLAA